MSTVRSFTTKGVCASLEGISCSKLHSWAQLPPLSERPTRESMVNASVSVHQYVCIPRRAQAEEWIFIPQKGDLTYSIQDQNFSDLDWILDMTREHDRIDFHLGLASQQELILMTSVNSESK